MEEQQIIFEEEESIDFIAILLHLLKYWHFVFIGISIAIVAAYFYTKFRTSVYEVNTTLMVANGASTSSTEKVLEEMDLFSNKKNIQNEIVILQSYSTIRQTIKQLDFTISYYSYNGYTPLELYHTHPFVVVFDSLDLQPVNLVFNIELINNNSFRISSSAEEYSLYSYQTDKVVSSAFNLNIDGIYEFGNPIKETACNFTIIKNPEAAHVLSSDYSYRFKFNNLNQQTLYYKAKLKVDVLHKDVDVLNLTLSGNNIEKSTDFLNKLSSVYINKGLEKKNSMANNTITFIDDQLTNITDSLTFAGNRLQNYRSTNKIMDIGFQSQQLFQRLSSLQTEKATLVSNREYYKYLIKSIKDNEGLDDLMIPATIGISDIALNKLIIDLVDLNTQKLSLSTNSNEQSYLAKNIDHKIGNIKKLILQNIQNIIEANRISILSIDNKINALDREVELLPEKQRKLFGFERKFNLNDAIYTFLLQKRAEAQIAKASNIPDSEVIDKARTDVFVKTSIKTLQIYLIALVIGLLIPIILIYFDFVLKDQITVRKDIEKITDRPIVGGVLQHASGETKAFANYPKSAFAESLRSFYTNLQFFIKGEDKQVILLSSAMSKEGKTFTAINLASTFASFNKKTCLLSFDLRLPKVHFAFNIDNKTGLSTYLINHSNIKDIIYSTDINQLDVIPAGPTPPNPVELIASEKTDELFKYLRANYDCVIIDSPPVGVVADGYLLAKHSDINIIVVRQDFSKKKGLDAISKDFKANNISNTVVAFNGIQQSRIRYGYGYGYGYAYSYYGTDKTSWWKSIWKKSKKNGA